MPKDNLWVFKPAARSKRIDCFRVLREEHKLSEITLALGTPHPNARFADTPLLHSRIGGRESSSTGLSASCVG